MGTHQQLAKLRAVGDCTLQPCAYVGPGFISSPPHRVGVAHLTCMRRFLLADPVGCGKTAQTLVAFGYLRERLPGGLRMVVLTPKSALFQWHHAVGKFLVGIEAEVVGYDKRRTPLTVSDRHMQYRHSTADILISTYHTAARDIDALREGLDGHDGQRLVVVFDEVQTLGNQGQRLLYPNALKLAQSADYVWGLSATPMGNRLEELHAVFEAIRPGTFGSHKAFMATYVRRIWIKNPNGKGRQRGFWKVLGYKNLDQLKATITPLHLKRPANVIDQHLPEVVTKDVHIEMTARQREIYDQIVAQRFPASGIDDEGRPLNKLASLCYAQMASDAPEVLGFVGVGSAKADWLLTFLQQAVTEKVIVYARYRRVVDYLCERLTGAIIPHVRITGAEDAKARDDARQRFNTAPPSTDHASHPAIDAEEQSLNEQASRDASTGVNVIVLNAAGGQALDLQSANIVVFFDLPWSWGEYQQVLGRSRRIGSIHSKILSLLPANTTSIDLATRDLLIHKETLVQRTLGLDEAERSLTAQVENCKNTEHSINSPLEEIKTESTSLLPTEVLTMSSPEALETTKLFRCVAPSTYI